MLKLLSRLRRRTITTKSNILYTNCDIPARLFFNNLSAGDLSVLGTGTQEELQVAYYSILDEYCELDNNTSFIEAFKKEEIISLIQSDIATIETALHAIIYVELTKDERISIIDKLNEWKPPHAVVRFDKDKPLLDEALRIQKKVIGALKNRLNQEVSTRKKRVEKVKRTFESDCVAIEIALQVSINDDVSLRKFIEYSKQAIERSKQYILWWCLMC